MKALPATGRMQAEERDVAKDHAQAAWPDAFLERPAGHLSSLVDPKVFIRAQRAFICGCHGHPGGAFGDAWIFRGGRSSEPSAAMAHAFLTN
jgi:hypothetical protein